MVIESFVVLLKQRFLEDFYVKSDAIRLDKFIMSLS